MSRVRLLLSYAAMKAEARKTLFSFAIELVIYGFLIAGYFLFVLHFLGPSLAEIEKTHVRLYALVAVALVLGQSIALEFITTFLIRLLRGRSE